MIAIIYGKVDGLCCTFVVKEGVGVGRMKVLRWDVGSNAQRVEEKVGPFH
jgi:hypothetical protein